VTLGERLQAIIDGLPAGWAEAPVVLTAADPAEADRAALILGPLAPGRAGASFHLTVTPAGRGGASPDATRRALDRLEREGIDARLVPPDPARVPVAAAVPPEPKPELATSFDALAARLPEDWSDAYLELELASSDELDRAALLLAPVNPFLHAGAKPALRFRVARRFGYGAATSMGRRTLARLDEAGIGGTLRLLRVQSDTRPVLTQGPVWREAGRAV
jgi:hypothetical protein